MFTYCYFSLASPRAHGDFSNWRISSSCIGTLPCLSLTQAVDRSCTELQAPSSSFLCSIVPQKSTTNDHNDRQSRCQMQKSRLGSGPCIQVRMSLFMPYIANRPQFMGGSRTMGSKYYDNSLTAPSRGFKCWITEGGIRCPCLVRYPLYRAS